MILTKGFLLFMANWGKESIIYAECQNILSVGIRLARRWTPTHVQRRERRKERPSTVPFENAERFSRLMKEAGNECVLVPFEGKAHGFFNGSLFRKSNRDADFDLTMKRSIEFLKLNGILK